MNQIVPIIRRHWMPLLGLNSILLAATIYAATIYADKTSHPVWMASAQLTLPQTGGSNIDLGPLGSIENGGVGFSKELNPLQIQSAILTSDIVLSRVRAADPEKNLYPGLDGYKGLFTVTPQDQSTVMVVEAEGSSPELAHKRVDTLIDVYQQRLNELRRNETDVREQFARKDLQKSRNNLTQAQNSLAKFRKSTGIVNSEEQTRTLIEAIDNLKNTQATVAAESRANEAQAKETAARLGMTPRRAMNSLRLGENKEYQAIRDEVSKVNTALAQARGNYTDESPQVQSLLQQRQQLQRELNQRFATAVPGAKAGEVDTTLGGSGNGGRDSRVEMITELIRTQNTAKGLQQQAAQIQNQVGKLGAELKFISANQTRLAELERNYDIAEGVHKGTLARLQQSETNPFNAYPNVQVLDEPTTSSPSKPKRWLIFLGGILASIFGSLALVLSRESRNPLLSPKDIQQVELPVLVSISRLRRPDMERDLGADVEIEFQRLASAISSLTLENQRLMVTSSTFGEGKTTVTLGLALALVNFGFRVLIVDADLRQAEMTRRLGRFQTKLEGSPKQTPVPIHPGLDLMTAPHIPKDKIAEFFARGGFEKRLNVVQDAGDYDYVLVDSPPVSLTIEPTLMSSVVHNILFVVRPGTSDRYSVMDGFEQLTRKNARITGLVVNGVESRTEGYRYGRQRELLEAEA